VHNINAAHLHISAQFLSAIIFKLIIIDIHEFSSYFFMALSHVYRNGTIPCNENENMNKNENVSESETYHQD
jgi:hypothetical protein